MTTSTWIALAALATAGTAALVLADRNRELARRIEALEAAPTNVPRGAEAAGSPALSGEGALATRREVTDLAERLAALARRAEPLLAAGASPGTAPASGGAAAAALDRRVEEAVAKQFDGDEFKRRVAEAAKQAGQPAIDKKPAFAALATYLGLDAAQEGDLRRDLEDVQGSLFALLADRRPDGRVLLEEIAAVEPLPETDPQRAKVFLDICQLKIPGTEETYLARAMTLAFDFHKRAAGYLRPDQAARLTAADIDLFGVKFN